MYSKSFKVSELSECIKEASNLVDDEFKLPSLNFIKKFQIVVCTPTVASCFVRARIQDLSYDPKHFSHVFIDEAASVQEPVSLIAIAGKYYL